MSLTKAFSVERKKKIVIKMPKFATEIAELVTARVTILNIWHFVQKLIIYINIELVVTMINVAPWAITSLMFILRYD